MIAVDANILVYAHRADSPFHTAALARVRELAEGSETWAIPWPCIHEFLAIVTHPKVYLPATPLTQAIDQVAAWMESPKLVLLGEPAGYWAVLRSVLEGGAVSGPRVHDASIYALCRAHRVHELWTADRDFGRFSGLRTRNPLAGGKG